MSDDHVNQLSAPQSGSRIAEFESIAAQSEAIETTATALLAGIAFKLKLTYKAGSGVTILVIPGTAKSMSSVGAGLIELLSPGKQLMLTSIIRAKGTNSPIDGDELRRLAVGAWCEAANIPSPNEAEMKLLLAEDQMWLTRPELVELIDRLCNERGNDLHRAVIDGDICPSFEDLRWFIETTKELPKRDRAYFALEKLGQRTHDPDVAEFMMARVKLEKNKHTKTDLLFSIPLVASVSDSSNAVELIHDSNVQLRMGVMRALGQCRDQKAHAALVNVIENEEDGFVLIDACYSLGKTGTKEDVPILLELLKRSDKIKKEKTMVRSAVLNAVRQLDGARNVQLFASSFEKDPSPIIKRDCLMALCEYGTEEHIGPVLARVRTLVMKKNRQEEYPNEFTLAMVFLRRFNTPEISRFYDWLNTKKDSLLQVERQYIKENGLPIAG